MYYLTADEHTYTISEPEDSDDRWAHQGDYGLSVTPRTLHASEPTGEKWGWEKVDDARVTYDCEEVTPGNLAYVVIVEYTDGGTFGSNGYWQVAGVYSTPEAAKACESRCVDENDRPANTTYRPWDGYFACLSSASTVAMVVLP